MLARFSRFSFVAPTLAVVLACQNSDKAADLGAKEQQLAAKEQQIKEEALTVREQALAAREQAAAQVAASPTPPAAPEAAPRPGAPVQSARTAVASAAPEAPTAVAPHAVLVTVNVTVDMTKPGGQQWDGLGDAPDPLITATVVRSGQTATSLTKNALNATATLQLDLQQGDTVSINVVDKDLAANDPIGSFAAIYSGGSAVRQGKLGAGSIKVTFGGA